MGRLRTIHRLHRRTPVVPAAIPGVAGGYPGDSSRSDCRGWTAGRVEAPLVGICGGSVAAQFRAGHDWCARGEGPDRRLRLDGGRRGISAWGGRAPGTWRRGHPQLRRRRPQTGTGRPGTSDPEGGPLNPGFSRSQSMPSDLPKLTPQATDMNILKATMRAAQVSRPGGPLELVERPIPEPGPGSVRIKVQACGICHSDVFTKDGLWPGITFPRVPGHEVVGVIDAVGKDVPGWWQPGQRVGVGWHAWHCLSCDNCRRG